MSTWQFVDSIASSPTVRLDLNSATGGLMLASEPELSPPDMDRVTTASMLADGEKIPAAAFRNRMIRLPIQLVYQSTTDLAAAKLQALARELVRQPGNILRTIIGSSPMFFRTFPAPDAAYQLMLNAPHWGNATLEIPCEPFGYGLKEVLSQVTVTNNPAAGSNGMFFDVASPKGDVETPLTLTVGNGTTGLGATGRLRSAFAVRRRGTVANYPLVLQAEAMTQGTDTTTQANSASFSGSGNNWSRCTFATATSGQRRIYTSTTFPTASTDARGKYRAFVRGRKTVAGDSIDVRLQWGDVNAVVKGPLISWPGNTGIQYIDLGTMQIPVGYDPVYDGESGVEIATDGTYIDLYVRRNSGTGNFDMDLLLFLPADDDAGTGFVKWPTVQPATTDTFVYRGGPSPSVFCLNNLGQVRATELIEIASGRGLMVTPNRTNRVFFVRDVGTGTAAAGGGDSLTATHTIIPSYYPRYLFPLRPVST